MSMVLPIKRVVNIYGTDSFELEAGWKNSAGAYYDLTTYTGFMYFYTSYENRTLLKTVTNGVSGSRIVLAATFPNIYIRIIDTETGIGSDPNFASIPGYCVLDLAPADAELTYRLMEGRVIYEL